MKIRKVCSFILTLTLVLSSLSISFAGEKPKALTDIAGKANSQAINVCNYLGIVNGNPDGTYLPDKPVTRAEFAAMITRALAVPESALAGYGNTKFKDTSGYGWAVPYLAFCESKGILLGDGQGNVMPGKTITLNEAITMALRAVGYTANSSMLTGSWPSNYISIAQNNDLYEDVAGDAILNRANSAQIIYNTLFVQKVSVMTDGETVYFKNSSGDASTMLNTGLDCTVEKGVVNLEDYPDTLINLGPYMGAYGEIYLNEDDEVVAVNPTATRLMGNFNATGTRFDTITGAHYQFDNAKFTSPASVYIENTVEKYTFTSCAAFAIKPVTVYVDLKGDKISKFYSVNYWKRSERTEAESDIQDEISEDKTINGWKLPLGDDGEIDYAKFYVQGVASLMDIKEDDVLYIYQNGNTDDEVAYINVGTKKLSGEVTEFDSSSNDYYYLYTINDQTVIPAFKYDPLLPTLDVGSTYDIRLEAQGSLAYADKTSGATDTYGVVKAATAETSFDNYKVKLYTSEDATKTLYLSEEDPADIDWTSSAATTISAVTRGALIGYSIDSDGTIDAIDNTYMTSGSIVFKSSKVLGNYSIDPDAFVFTYNGSMSNTDSYDVVKLSDIAAGTTVATAASPAAFILNDDGDVAALFIEDDFADAADDAVYGVINKRTTTSNTDGDKVYKFTGFIDAAAFTYKTDDNTGFDGLTNKFGVYAITLDASGQITEIAELDKDGTDSNGNDCSYLLNTSDAAETITALDSDNTVITAGSDMYTVADEAVVYKYDTDDKEYSVSKLSAIDVGDTISLYDTKGKDRDGIATVVIYIAN